MKPRHEMTLAELTWPARSNDLRIDACVRWCRPSPPAHDESFAQALQLDWERTEAACEVAYKSFRQHRNKARYRAEINAITRASA